MKNKNNIVVVGDAGYEGQQLIGVFSSKKKAIQAIKDMSLDDKRMFEQYAFCELEVNQQYRGWNWIFDKDENGKYIAEFYESTKYGDVIEC
jgi:hypothetical protein